MPLVRIDLRKGRDANTRGMIAQVVYDAMLAVGVPEHDRLQIITEHDEAGLIYDPEYLNIPRSDGIVIIQITWNEGRSVDQKKALFRLIADGLHDTVGMRREDVFIGLVEVKRENWSFGNGEAQYAS